MKLRDKRTGEIIEVNGGQAYVHCGDIAIMFRSLAELNEKLEDYEEPKLKNYYWISPLEGGVSCDEDTDDAVDKLNKEIGNYFDSREKAEKAVERLRAWKRLKDKGFEFEGIRYRRGHNYIEWHINIDHMGENDPEQFVNDLHFVFGGGEE